uniref:MobV family relaxase n=1 Tax=Enterococcus italicus TaxID=246144 RepID=UPI0021D53672|nr:MobV family relaxase [Enterococcus italicus]
MKKMKNGNLGGIQKHNQREFENHSNEDIDPERSDMNYDLVNDDKINYNEKVNQIIDEQRVGTRAIRKDAVKVDEWIISSDREFFNNLDPEQTKEFFQSVVDYFSENFGKQNVAYANVHLDETTPHMHMGVVPMKDGKLSSKTVFTREKLTEIQEKLPQYLNEKGFELSSKTVFTREKLTEIQEKLPQYLNEKGFDIERGIEGSKSKHHDTSEYKKLKENITKEQFEELSYDLDQAKKRNIVYQDILENDFKVKTIEPREMKARLVLNDLERGIQPSNLDQAKEWLRNLKNAVGTKIDPSRLAKGIDKLEKIIKVVFKVVKGMTLGL